MSLDLSAETLNDVASGVLPGKSRTPQLIVDDAQALLEARRLADEFAPEAALRDRERRLHRPSLTHLWRAASGGLPCRVNSAARACVTVPSLR